MYILLYGLLAPLLGTVLGAACVFFMKGTVGKRVETVLNGFAAGVMTAASIWSLLIPAIDRSEAMGFFAFLPATLGLWLGIAFFHGADLLSAGLSGESEQKRPSRLILAVTLHNLPEGMAMGAVLAGWLQDPAQGAVVLAAATGIALQNFPEGAVISLPVKSKGKGKIHAFFAGALSGIVEPVGALAVLAASAFFVPLLPYLLGFAAGAMLFVVVEELVPSFGTEGSLRLGTVAFTLGFSIMMALDVALG